MTEAQSLALGQHYRANSWVAFKFVLRFLKPQLRRLLLVCLLDISIVLVNLATPWLGKQIIDVGFANKDWSLVLTLALGIAGLTGLVYGLTATRTTLYNVAEMLIGLDIRRTVYGHLQKLSVDYVEGITVGQAQFRATTDADRIAHMLVRILPTLTMLVEFALILAAAVYVDPVLAGIVLCFLIPWTLLFIWVTHFGRVLDRRRLGLCERRDASVLQDANSFATIKAYGRVRAMRLRNASLTLGVQRVAAQGYLILVGFEFFTQKLLPYVKSTTIYVLLVRKVIQGDMTLGMTVPLIAYLSRLSFPLERIVNFGCWIWQTMVSAERMMQLLTTEPSVVDAPNALRLDHLEGRISFSRVSFSRPEVGLVVDDVTLDVEPGRFVALVGPSGAGKSTLLGLALRFQDPDSGLVAVDGHDWKGLDRTSTLRKIGYVGQETFLFEGSLAHNLRISDPEASDDALWEVLRAVGLDTWARALTLELNQDLESGHGLSAGQRQRIGIARALLVNPKVLLLDEPTSALDAETEAQVMGFLRDAARGRTVLIATHRLHTITHADEIVVMRRGKIVERGTDATLRSANGLYAELVASSDLHQLADVKPS